MTATTTSLNSWEIILPRDLCEHVAEAIEKKQFMSADALITSALYQFRDLAEASRIKHARLKADLREAIAEADRGDLIDADEVFDRLERELQACQRI